MDATWDLGASLLRLCRPVTGGGVRPASCIGAEAECGCQVSPGLRVRPRLGRAQWQRDVIRLRGDSTRRPGRSGLGSHGTALHLLSPRSPCDPPTSPPGGDVATGQNALISAHASSCFLMVEAHFLPRP